MHSDKCDYCGKWVCHKPILGTMHFCLTEEERRAVDRAREAVEQQRRRGSPYDFPLRSAQNPYGGLNKSL